MHVSISCDDFLLDIKSFSRFHEYTITLQYSENISDSENENNDHICYKRDFNYVTEETVRIETYENFCKYFLLRSRKEFLSKCFDFVLYELRSSKLKIFNLINIVRKYSKLDADEFNISVSELTPCLFYILEVIEKKYSLGYSEIFEIMETLDILNSTAEHLCSSNLYNFDDYIYVLRDCLREYTLFDNSHAINVDYILTEYLKQIDIDPYNYNSVLEIIYRFNKIGDNSNENFINFIGSEDFDEIFDDYKEKLPRIKRELINSAYGTDSKNLIHCFGEFYL